MTLHRVLVLFLVGLALLAGLLGILQIWGLLFDTAFFFKLICTIVVLALVAGFLLVVKADFGEHKRLKDDNFID